MNVHMEERVAILLPDSPEWVFAFFGAMKIGAVAIPLNTNLKPSDYEYVLNDSRARVLFVHQSLLAHIEEIRARLDFLEHVVVAGGEASDEHALERMMSEASASLGTCVHQQGRSGVLALQFGDHGATQGRDPPSS